MLRSICTMLCFVMYYCGPSLACYSARHPKDSQIILMIVESSGDTCEFAKFPKPFDKLLGIRQGPRISEFRWTYAKKQYGVLQIQVDEAGNGTFIFGFHNGQPHGGAEWLQQIALLNESKNELIRISSQKGTGAREVWDNKYYNAPPEFWESVKYIRVYYQHAETGAPPPQKSSPKYMSVLRLECEWPSQDTNNTATGHLEFVGTSNTSCDDAKQNAVSQVGNGDACDSMGNHWNEKRRIFQPTGTCR